MDSGLRSLGWCVVLLGLSVRAAGGEEFWWERGADSWYYKDDWKGLKIAGASPLGLDIDTPEGGVGGWVVVWGENCRLYVNDQLVDQDLDACLIWDYDLAPFLSAGPRRVTLRLEARAACAEGEIIGRDGTVHRFITDANWIDARGKPAKTERMQVMRSSDAFDRAHNGWLLAYNDEERGKTAIAKCLARIQRLREQSIFLMRRFRPAEEIVSFDPNLPWRQAERIAAPLLEQAGHVLRQQSIPAQKAGRFSQAIATAQQAEAFIAAAEAPVVAATALYRAQRENTHLMNWVAILDSEGTAFHEDVAELTRLQSLARQEFRCRDWASVHEELGRLWELSGRLRPRLHAAARRKLGPSVCDIGALDEFPEDRFGWLNTRDLMSNDPSTWPFVVGPDSVAYVPLAGRWDFRLDPNNVGQTQKWYEETSDDAWGRIQVPQPWERQGHRFDNLKSPGDAPYQVPIHGDKPYNGYGWYRKKIVVPQHWHGRRLMLRLGKVRDWYRVFVNGVPSGEGVRAREDRRLIPDEIVSLPAEAIRFGSENAIVVQVYNHNNFGGIIAGRPALYLEGQEPQFVETPGPLSYALELAYPGESPMSCSALASAMSPAVVLACDQNHLELWGWQAKGYDLPESISFMGSGDFKAVGYSTMRLAEPGFIIPGRWFAEKWLVLQGKGANTLLVLEQQPQLVTWARNRQGSMSLTLRFPQGPARAVVLSLPAEKPLTEQQCRFWTQVLRRYPVSATECVRRDAANQTQSCLIRYNYLDLGQDETGTAITGAPVPMLASFACEHKFPALSVEDIEKTTYASPYAPYLLKANSDTLSYRMPAPDRSKMMKGVGELFGRSRVERNVHGGLGEQEMFRRMAEWGFDHCRYALAFDADWDLPLVSFRGGPISGDEALWKRLDELIANCNEAGMQMMLCSFTEIRSRNWKAHPEWQRTIFEFWRRIAERYAELPEWAISYDFFNEPAYMNTDHYNEIMKELTALVRSVDKRHRIVWEPGDGWAQPQWCLWMEPVDDSNVLYSFHHYGKHWGYAYDEYYPGYQATFERTQADVWLEAILFGIRHNVPIHCGEFGLSMLQPGCDGQVWLNDYLAFFERFGVGWNWWNYSGHDIYRTGLAMGDRVSPYVPTLRKWMAQSGWGKHGEAQEVIVFNDNGGWCWYQDERVLIHQNRLIIGSVANRSGTQGDQRWGNIEVTTYDLTAGRHLGTSVLHEHLQDDDHDAPALLVRPDGRLLAVYSRHGNDPLMRCRISERPGDPTSWQPEQLEKRGAGVTYSNLFRLSRENTGRGRIYNFYRGENRNPNLVASDDDGETWAYLGTGVVFNGRPYVKYASNNLDRIHFITTEGHPLEFRKNSIYHGIIRDSAVHTSDGRLIRRLADGPVAPEELTRIYPGDPNHCAWTIDLHIDAAGHPYALYSVQMNRDPNDNRYRYARWDGRAWRDSEIAFAGTCLCPGEIHYTGLGALDPADPNVVYISTNADPVTGKPLISRADGKRHYEIFRGTTGDDGKHWDWSHVTRDSKADNLRPIVPISEGGPAVLLWLRGTYSMYTNYDLQVVGMIGPRR